MRSLVHTLVRAACGLSVAIALPVLAQTPPDTQSKPLVLRQGLSMQMPELHEDTVLLSAIANPERSTEDRARDSQRRPYEALTFWGLTPGLTVVEIEPGSKGWWRSILEPYAAQTGGVYVPVQRPLETMGVADGEADLVLVSRALHNWARSDRTEPYLQAFFSALKPGGILAIEQHRSLDGLNVVETAPTGYVPESYVLRAARDAGFELEARSELNANPRDDRDHAFGVWTLAPTRRSQVEGRTLSAEERAAYDTIGESDRMTLRFRKPVDGQ